MVSQGWEVWLAWDIEGTYEEAPPTLIDHLKRDRRFRKSLTPRTDAAACITS